jgi:hypothetical protein
MNDEKRKKIGEIRAKLQALTEDQKNALVSSIGIVTIEGHILSPFNQLMLYYQFEKTTIIGGYKQWINAGRQVRKGEKSMNIYTPSIKGEKEENADQPINFFVASVFDISQTDKTEVKMEVMK